MDFIFFLQREMKIYKSKYIPLDKFLNNALYNKKSGYYMYKNPIGKRGDFITAPNISILFSEMIAIWIISFWQSLLEKIITTRSLSFSLINVLLHLMKFAQWLHKGEKLKNCCLQK